MIQFRQLDVPHHEYAFFYVDVFGVSLDRPGGRSQPWARGDQDDAVARDAFQVCLNATTSGRRVTRVNNLFFFHFPFSAERENPDLPRTPQPPVLPVCPAAEVRRSPDVQLHRQLPTGQSHDLFTWLLSPGPTCFVQLCYFVFVVVSVVSRLFSLPVVT